jgi:hypothetical protein
MNYTFNVFDRSPNNNWVHQSRKWEQLGKNVGTFPETYPLTIKALYVTGIILTACESIDILLNSKRPISTTFYPAYAIFASVIDLLGRCIRGNKKKRGSTEDIKTGFKWLARPKIESYRDFSTDQELVVTYTPWGSKNHGYTISELTSMRHFASHGQASSENLPAFDYSILGKIPPILGRGIEEYLRAIESYAEPCAQLANARVIPYRDRPIFDVLWQHYGRDRSFPNAIGNALRKYGWNEN